MKAFLPLTLALLAASVVAAQVVFKDSIEKKSRQVLSSDVKWGALNPARGKKAPRGGTIWGDRTNSMPSVFFVEFVDGFSSPPHIHNVSYRGVVIDGLVHNDDPNAEEMWMPVGSFWTKPAGEFYITSAKGEKVLAYMEIDSGPYFVQSKRLEQNNYFGAAEVVDRKIHETNKECLIYVRTNGSLNI